MANRPRADNPHRSVRVEDDLWRAAEVAAAKEGTTRGEVMREALRELVERQPMSDAVGGECARCGDTFRGAAATLAWLGRHAHGTGEASYFRRWTTRAE